MITLIVSIFLASLTGSLHCAGMCGAFLAFAVGLDGSRSVRARAALQSAYHVGRLATYTALGVVAGGLGAAFNTGGELLGVQRVAVVCAGSLMVGFGVITVLRLNGVKLPAAPVPQAARRLAERTLRSSLSLPPLLRAASTGLATTLLPCGWLYAFVITAAGTGRPGLGALTMAVFWLGTLPALVAVGAGVQSIAARLPAIGRRVPLITATIIVAVGLLTVFGRGAGELPVPIAGPRPTLDALVQRVRTIDQTGPTCHDDAAR
ncbi:MAG: sulfite exporter TauE/SafE family protein [Planctomycetota bacterium]|nr:sulfite exporter TauE/SafE family protein [Planctomycetota bacterium]